MKRLFLALAIALGTTAFAASPSNSKLNSNEIEVVNDSTVILHDVERIEVFQKTKKIVCIYNEADTLIWAQGGTFTVELPRGDYKVVMDSNRVACPIYRKEYTSAIIW